MSYWDAMATLYKISKAAGKFYHTIPIFQTEFLQAVAEFFTYWVESSRTILYRLTPYKCHLKHPWTSLLFLSLSLSLSLVVRQMNITTLFGKDVGLGSGDYTRSSRRQTIKISHSILMSNITMNYHKYQHPHVKGHWVVPEPFVPNPVNYWLMKTKIGHSVLFSMGPFHSQFTVTILLL